MLLGVGEESLSSSDLAQLEVGRVPVRLVTQDLVAKGDGVVVEASGEVAVRR